MGGTCPYQKTTLAGGLGTAIEMCEPKQALPAQGVSIAQYHLTRMGTWWHCIGMVRTVHENSND